MKRSARAPRRRLRSAFAAALSLTLGLSGGCGGAANDPIRSPLVVIAGVRPDQGSHEVLVQVSGSRLTRACELYGQFGLPVIYDQVLRGSTWQPVGGFSCGNSIAPALLLPGQTIEAKFHTDGPDDVRLGVSWRAEPSEEWVHVWSDPFRVD